ncbi:protein NODULATION SIGNALING PATHWAY 2-like [Juglans microcarpa x Juglans regia]|uniref:protein NODULATION SIGNALING PATHWAY 2-like n=1 Tax=Juglans microcarpa x Juglans regia TaxID=2249226 RepID=UPI001B7EB530|nr:protein NODULATION SIGNALING PATHWAY 2-like [Juglans microcarpa x Juglans regia]
MALSSSMNSMEYEEIDYIFNSSCIEELHVCSLETGFSLEKEDHHGLISPNIIQDVAIDDDEYTERLLQLEAGLVDFDSICRATEMDLESSVEIGSGHDHKNQENQENVSISTEGGFALKGIQEELMQESSLTDLLLMGAEAVEAQNWALVSTAVEKLNDLLIDIENIGDESFKRLALFFTQGLHSKSINALKMQHDPVALTPTNRTIYTFQMLQELSPYVKFAHFTANQAILEATQGDHEIHVIDFDMMEGIQWPPLMVELSMRKDTFLRLTAIIAPDEENTVYYVQQTGKRLKDFADSINFPFMFDHMVMAREEDFESIKVGNTFIANCMIHQLHMPYRSFSLVKTFLGGVFKLSPKIFILVQEELFNFARIQSMSFVEFFCEALHHYTALTDSLVNSFCGVYKMGFRLIEKEFLESRILDSLSQFPNEKEKRMLWGEGDANSFFKGFRRIPLSSGNICQAKSLASLFSGGYWVQHEKSRLALCWKSRPLTTASIWVPKPKTKDKLMIKVFTSS